MKGSKPIRAAVVGCGFISTVHARALEAHRDGISLVACADVARDRARELARHSGGAAAYEDYRQMLDEQKPDLLIVATWPNLHEEQVLEAAARGVPMILCEKSLAMSATSAKRMADAARRSGTVLVEGFMGRHHPRTLDLEHRVRDGEIGPLRKIRAGFQRRALERVTWKHNPQFGGVIFDFTCYCVNAVGAFTTQLPERVHAHWQRRDDGLIVELHGMMHYPDGLVAIVESSYTCAYQQPLELHGEKGILRVQDAWTGDGASGIQRESGRNPTVLEHLTTPVADRAECQVLHLCQCLRTGEPPRFAIDESVRNHAVIDALVKSAQSGQAVRPELP